MKEKQQFTLQSLVAVFVLNAVLLAAIFVIAGEALADHTLAVVGVGAVLTLVLWFVIQRIGHKLIEQAATPAVQPKAEAAPAPKTAPAPKPLPERSDAAAVQILSILQRKGRLIDFLQEDIRGFQDAQIGAAVRNVHEGCREALAEYVTLEPVYAQDEGSPVTVQKGFDAREVRLIGNVSGEPPFKGTLRHRGWRVARLDLPERVGTASDDKVVAAAEVEVGN